MEVFIQRLEQEYGAQPVVTAPAVTYKAKIFGSKNIKKIHNDVITFNNPAQFPDSQIVNEFYEPMIVATIITPSMYNFCFNKRCSIYSISNVIHFIANSKIQSKICRRHNCFNL